MDGTEDMQQKGFLDFKEFCASWLQNASPNPTVQATAVDLYQLSVEHASCLEELTGLLQRYILQPFETCFFNTKIKLETTISQLQCSGV